MSCPEPFLAPRDVRRVVRAGVTFAATALLVACAAHPAVQPSGGAAGETGSAVMTTTPGTTTSTAIATTTTTSAATTTTAAATTTTTAAATTTTTAPTTIPAVADPSVLPGPWTEAVAADLAARSLASSVVVWHDGAVVFGSVSGSANDGTAVVESTPFVVASVSKLVTALSVARLSQAGLVDLEAPVPWAAMGITPDPAWGDVTPTDLLTHRSGMPVRRQSWLDQPGSCAVPLAEAVALPPEPTRGTWRYSNGNYCALGLLVQHVTGASLDDAARLLVLAPAGVTGGHLTTGPQPGDAPYAPGTARLDRLGGAGTWMMSPVDVARMLAAATPADREVLAEPAVMTDQYGWGHTGTVDGAKACAWVLDAGPVIVAAVAGNLPGTGGALCDLVVTAVVTDLGIAAGPPDRLPR